MDTFDSAELCLDEENDRFQRADNQRACLKKIYEASPKNFRSLMESISGYDLGEPLLVYVNPEDGDKVVMDGDRRASAIKVLTDPDLAPNIDVWLTWRLAN